MLRSTFGRSFSELFQPTGKRRRHLATTNAMGFVQELESRQLLSASPTLVNIGPNATYNNDFQPVILIPNASIWDADDNLAGGKLRANIKNGQQHDRLTIVSGNGVGTSSSSIVTVDGVEVGVVVIGIQKGPLEVLFNASATGAQVERVARQIGYASNSNIPLIETRKVAFTVFDAEGNASSTKTKFVDISDVPVLRSLSTSTNYRVGAPFTLLGSSISLANSGDDFGGSKFLVTNQTIQSGDRLIVASLGAITVAGNEIYLQGNLAATFSGGTGVSPLAITFVESATYNTVRGVLNNVAYSNPLKAPALGIRTVGFMMTDGGGLNSNQVTTSFQVLNDLKITNPTPEPTYVVSRAAVMVASRATVEGAAPYLYGSKLSAFLNTIRANDSLEIIAWNGITVSGNDLYYNGNQIGTIQKYFSSEANSNYGVVVTFNNSVSRSAVTATVQALAFKAYNRAPSLANRVVTMTLTDTQGINGAPATQTVHISNQPVINPVNTPSEYFYSPGVTQPIMSTALVFDGGGNYGNGVLSGTFKVGQPGDELVVMETASLKIINGKLVLNGVTVADYVPGTTTSGLKITFVQNVREGDVQAVLGRIGYRNLSSNPATVQRIVAFQFTDGTGAASPVLSKKINYLQ